MCSSGSSQPGSSAKCIATVNVPFGTPLAVSTCAGLMSSFASGPLSMGAAPDFCAAAGSPTVRRASMATRVRSVWTEARRFMSILLVIWGRARKRDGNGTDPEKLHHYGQVAALGKSTTGRYLGLPQDSGRLQRARRSPDDTGAVSDRDQHRASEKTDGTAGGARRSHPLVFGNHAHDQRAERRHPGEGHRVEAHHPAAQIV